MVAEIGRELAARDSGGGAVIISGLKICQPEVGSKYYNINILKVVFYRNECYN